MHPAVLDSESAGEDFQTFILVRAQLTGEVQDLNTRSQFFISMLGVKKKKDEAGDTLESQSLSRRKPKEEEKRKSRKKWKFPVEI